MKSSLITQIESAVKKAQNNQVLRTEIFSEAKSEGKNQFLFFIKPELTQADPQIKFVELLGMILGKLDEFNMQIKNALLLPASYLEKHGIIAQHYGVINAIARGAKENLTAEAKEKFFTQYGIHTHDAEVLGGLEFLQKYPQFTPTTTDYIWQNSSVQKLGGGAYCGAIKIDGNQVFLLNGFHPRQLEHFINYGRSIVAFTLTSDTSWSEARNNFIGKTNPNDAEKGSIRRTLLDEKDRFGLKTVSSSWNGVHLSAGPIEGLIELMRYNSDFDKSIQLTHNHFSFGRELTQLFGGEKVEKILKNPNVEFEGKTLSVFEVTEEKNTQEALDILKSIFE